MIVDPNTPQATPLTGYPGIKTSDQIVNEIHGAMAALPPEHQAALDHGLSMMKSPESGMADPGGSISPGRVGGMSGAGDSAISVPPDKLGGIAIPGAPPSMSGYSKPGPYVTGLSPEDEQKFGSWVKSNKIPFDNSPSSDYDMRGYWKAQQSGDANAATKDSAFDGKPHFPDTYKTPYHKTFSNESMYATPDAPHWDGDRLIGKDGAVVADESAPGGGISQASRIPGMVGVSSADLERPPDAANLDALPLPAGRSISGRTATLESPGMMHPGSAAYEPLPHPAASPAATELNRLRDSSAGWHGIHNPFLKVLAGIGDVAGSGLFPQFSQFIPGTSAHHEQLIQGKESQVGDEQRQQKVNEEAQKSADESVTAAANARHLNAEADSAANKPPATITTDKGIMQWNPTTHAYDVMAGAPAPKEEIEGKTVTTSQGIMQWNPKTHAYDIKVGDAEAKDQQNVHVLPDGSVVAVHHDPKTGKSTAAVVYKGDPKIETEVTKLEVGGKPHTVLVNKKTGETVKDLGETGEKPPNVNINQGTWSIQEDANGKPIEYNSKTGETRAVAAGGVQKAGTKEKHDSAEEKRIGPGRDALKYADDYMKTGAFTGPGDVALQEKFFELAKPSSGFRMTKEQMSKIQNSASWMGSLEGKAYHALHGTWFSPAQREEIVTTMKSLQGTHEPASGGSGKSEEWVRDASGKLVKK